MLLDDIVVKELPNTNYANYFFPEESLSAFNGELASGYWTLEIHDARAGQAGKLLDWELNLTYSSTNVNMITVVPGTTQVQPRRQEVTPISPSTFRTLRSSQQIPSNNPGPNALDVIFNQTYVADRVTRLVTFISWPMLDAPVPQSYWRKTAVRRSSFPASVIFSRYKTSVHRTRRSVSRSTST